MYVGGAFEWARNGKGRFIGQKLEDWVHKKDTHRERRKRKMQI